MKVRERVASLVREHLGLELDDSSSMRVEELATRYAPDARQLEAWFGELSRQEAGSSERRALIAAVTNGQTYFMRDPAQLTALQAWLTNRASELGRELHVWSAGCSTGEEAYTLSMLGLRVGVPLQILASDLNPESIERARKGVYSEWSLRHVEQVERIAYFRRVEGGFEVRERVRDAITFRVHNLAAGCPLVPNSPDLAWDGILCRNVLIYFADAVRQRVIAEFEEMLIEGGALLLSSSESLRGLKTGLRAQPMNGGFVFVRESAPRMPPPSLPPRSLPEQSSAPVPARSPTSVAPADAPQASSRNRAASNQWLELGNERLRQHAFEQARDCYREAVALDGVSFEPYLFLAIVDLKQGAFELAKASLRSALFLEPRCWAAEYLLAGVLAREGREAEQAAALRRTEALLSRGDDLTYISDPSGIEPLCYTREQALNVCRARLHAMKKGLLP